METTNYNKQHILNQELKRIEETTERVKSASELLSSEVEFFKMVSSELEGVAKVIIPSVKEYIKILIEVRMGFAREVQDILRSSRELTELTKMAPKILDIVEVITKLNNVLSEDLVEKIKKTFNVEG